MVNLPMIMPGRSWWLENLGIEPGPKRSSDALKLETRSDNGLG